MIVPDLSRRGQYLQLSLLQVLKPRCLLLGFGNFDEVFADRMSVREVQGLTSGVDVDGFDWKQVPGLYYIPLSV